MKASIRRFRVVHHTRDDDNADSESSAAAAKANRRSPSRVEKVAPCSRCRAFKKKCSRTAPTCTLCEHAGQNCSLSITAATSWTEVQRLEKRVAWLSDVVQRGLLSDGASIRDFETGFDILRASNNAQSALQPDTCTSSNPDSDDVEISADWPVNKPKHVDTWSNGQLRRPETQSMDLSSLCTTKLPQNTAAKRLVDAYFRNVHRAYPFVDCTQVLKDLEIFGRSPSELPEDRSRLLYLIMAVGCTSLQRAGQVSEDAVSRFDIDLPAAIADCMKNNVSTSIQMLVLLALYSLFVPDDPGTLSIVNLACSQAISSGLAQDARSAALSPVQTEHQRRLFWSVFVLDRMMATSTGVPAAFLILQTTPLPALKVDEFASEDRPHFARMLQTNRQVVLLRQIECQIMQRVHCCGTEHSDPHSRFDQMSIIRDIRISIEDWYTSGCLTSPPEEDNVPVHNSVTWLSARYYYLLILLYYPRESNVESRQITAKELLGYVQRHLKSQSALLQQRQLPLNRVALARLFPVGIVIACCAEAAGQSDMSIVDCVVELVALLESFSDRWNLAHRGAQILRDLHDRLKSSDAPGCDGSIHEGICSDIDCTVTEQSPGVVALAELIKLIREELAGSTCFAAASMMPKI